jgi:hypothetical protein
MNAYEITKADGTTVTLNASGYSWDKRVDGLAFYDAVGNKVAVYKSDEWTALHMRSALVVSATPKPKATGVTHADYMMMFGH